MTKPLRGKPLFGSYVVEYYLEEKPGTKSILAMAKFPDSEDPVELTCWNYSLPGVGEKIARTCAHSFIKRQQNKQNERLQNNAVHLHLVR